MPFIDYNTRKRIQIWDGVSGPVYHSEKSTIGHFTLEAGIDLPSHSHPHEQWANLVEGEMEFTVSDETILMKPGMTAYIPSNVPHAAKAITECKVIDVFIPPREDFIELETKS